MAALRVLGPSSAWFLIAPASISLASSSGVLFFLSEPVAFRRVCGLESYSRTSGQSNHHRQSASDTRVPRYQLHHEDDSSSSGVLVWSNPWGHRRGRTSAFFRCILRTWKVGWDVQGGLYSPSIKKQDSRQGRDFLVWSSSF